MNRSHDYCTTYLRRLNSLLAKQSSFIALRKRPSRLRREKLFIFCVLFSNNALALILILFFTVGTTWWVTTKQYVQNGELWPDFMDFHGHHQTAKFMKAASSYRLHLSQAIVVPKTTGDFCDYFGFQWGCSITFTNGLSLNQSNSWSWLIKHPSRMLLELIIFS